MSMTELARGSVPSLPGALPCSALDAEARWDDATELRGELYVADHLISHAEALARAHGESTTKVRPGPLWQRFLAVRAGLDEAYAILTTRLESGREPTPAEEWLLDNSHIVQDQVREIEEDLPRGYLRKLPRLAHGRMRGYPRVYAICLDYLRHTDARVEPGSLSDYVLSYQKVRTLQIGELWAIPIMLRLGLLLTVAALATSEASEADRTRADTWADALSALQAEPSKLRARLAELDAKGPPANAPFLVHLMKRLREHDETALSAVFDWMAAESQKLGGSPEELARVQHLRQAADQVSVGNAVTSMRAVAAFDWNDFFERTSAVEAALREDPAGAYALTDKTSRDRYRHAVESIARRSEGDECDVAQAAVELAAASFRKVPDDRTRGHVGYYLVDDGRPALEERLGYRSPLFERMQRWIVEHPALFYFGVLGTIAGGAWAVCAFALVGYAAQSVWLYGALLLLLLPLSELGLTVVNALAIALTSPRLLPRLALDKGVLPEHRTLVVVPCLLDSKQSLAQLLEDLEVRSLANPDPGLHFALLTDFTDSESEERPEDAELRDAALAGIAALNARYADQDYRYCLFHRHRVWSRGQRVFMGWDRKRGKLEELNRLLRGATDTTYSVVTMPSALLASVKYVITLDADTELPREVARKLVATLAHPLNEAELDVERQRIVRGYGIAQPRVGTLPLSTRRSRFAAIAGGRPGIDPYTTAVSDVYQDLFGEGSYVGKAIYNVDAFNAALEGRVPENLLLSHDLFEGTYVRSALVTDIEVLDEQPASYEVQAARQHRWIRGDWQLLSWLFPRVPTRGGERRKNDLRALDWWKLFDNLRRSLLPIALVSLVVGGWFAGATFAAATTALLAVVLALPVSIRFLLDLFRESTRPGRAFLGGLGGDFGTNLLQVVLTLSFLLDQALVSLDAIVRTLYRLYVSKRDLLAWTTMGQSARSGHRVALRTWLGSLLALAMGGALALVSPAALPFAVPVLGSWVLAPLIAQWLGRPLPQVKPADRLSAADRQHVRLTARKTWLFFETFVTKEDHFLPPDNYQEDPRGVVAHRTSPTNIGLYLLSAVAARDFGFITTRELVTRLGQTLGTIESLPRRDGHILNWYDTLTLRPLDPQYISSVDSGNLAAYLWTLRSACEGLVRAPLVELEAFAGVLDCVRLARAALAGVPAKTSGTLPAELDAIEQELRTAAAPNSAGSDVATRLETIAGRLAKVTETMSRDGMAETRAWLERGMATARSFHAETRAFLPFAARLAASPSLFRAAPLAEPFVELERTARGLTTLEALTQAAPALEVLCEELEQTLEVAVSASSDALEEARRFLADLREDLRSAHAAASNTLEALTQLGVRSAALADGMNFCVLFDEHRELFVTGYNVSNARLDTSHYDLLASEARLASLVAVAKGDVPQEHWFRLGRPRTAVRSRRTIVSWSGSMFEYLMPLLVTKKHPDTLLDEACESAVYRQREYAGERGVPWGISESAYNVMDLEMTYQYRAFGVPGLGLKPGLGEDLVVAPYATALAALVDPASAVKNLRALAREGLFGRFGYYEAIDYSPSRVPPGKKGVIVKCYMAHHHGMTLVALDNVLHDNVMQSRFHADARIKASELLLEERVPMAAPLLSVAVAAASKPTHTSAELDVTEHVRLGPNEPSRLHLLGHGALSTLISSTGTGVLSWKGLDLNRFREDPVHEAGGIYVYLNDRSARRIWSAGFHPTCATPDQHDVAFAIDRVVFQRRDGAVETVTEILPSPEHAAEVRRLTLTNHGARAVDLELTTYTELVLAPRGADIAHRAFSSMFIDTEAVPELGALLARRRPRSAKDAEVWAVQVLAPEDEGFGPLEFETSRKDFIGRGRTLESPAALVEDRPLAGHTGSVLDPVFALRRRVRLDPNRQVHVTLTTALAATREEALWLAELYAAPPGIARALELGWADARVELRHLGITAAQSHRFQKLLSALLFPEPALRGGIDPARLHGRGRDALWGRGVSGDLPILLLRVDQPEFAELCRELLLAHEFWRINGVSVDFVILNEEPSGYMQPLQEALLGVIRASHSQGHVDQRGGVFVRRADQISDNDHALLMSAARVVLTASAGSLARQLIRATAQRRQPAEALPSGPRALVRKPPASEPAARPELVFDNGFGGFRPDGSEYVIVLGGGLATPLPWCNVFANPQFGSVVSEQGSSYTWFSNSQRHRLTPWSNDAVRDPSGENIYVRDHDDGSVWSPTPYPAGRGEHFVVSHGQGYSRFEHTRSELAHELTIFVSAEDAVKVSRLRLQNRSRRARRLSLCGVVEWVLGSSREAGRLTTVTQYDSEARAVLARNPFGIFPEGAAFFSASHPVRSFTASRDEFFGTPGSVARPAALDRRMLSGRAGAGLDPCAALEVLVQLAPGESVDVSFVLGHAPSTEQAHELSLRYQSGDAIERALEEARGRWQKLLSAVQVKTPDPSFDFLVNHWLLYQALSCRIWARSGYYQSSGAFGFRDQVQDVLALLHTAPELAREHLLRAAARQFVEGDVQHWWHPEAGDGVRTHCSDDMLWLPYATAAYVRVTGDRAILDENVAFLSERLLGPEEDDLYSTPASTPHTATLYEHCVRALDAGTTAGPHGLPLMRGGDWNDGMNRVGQHGRGESVWLAWFLIRTLLDFRPLSEARGDGPRVTRCEGLIAELTHAVETHGWDGTWYRRAYFDDGTPLGSHTESECRIDAIAQSWAVIAGTGNRTRATLAVHESESLLVREHSRFMALLWPPFEQSPHDPGYILAYPAGIRENGGQYTHGVLWTLQALALSGEAERVEKMLDLLNPIQHATTRELASRYKVEPYVVVADIYSARAHLGRGGWTWYTGSAAWMYRILVEDLIGLKRMGDRLMVSPCVPPSWKAFDVVYRYGTSELQIHVENGAEHGVAARVEIDGREVSDGAIPLIDDGRRRQVRVLLGETRLRSSA